MAQNKPAATCDSGSRHYPLARLKAIVSEQRASVATDPAVRQDWEELAIEWHLLANLAGPANAPTPAKDTSKVMQHIESLAGAMHDVARNR
ncbi:hypothetical protein [Rhodopseudomonas palustris]|uniref:Uncharacterized protein n=1 Tax=Rhodopseudomonas palustris (strain BisB18) TaxID=316056 RepID=Q218S4_RHOPB